MSTPGTGVPSLTDVYNTIKAQETNFPIPQTTATYVVGTFDAAFGRFTYSVPTYTEIDAVDTQEPRMPIIKPRPPIKLTGGKLTSLNAENVILQFNVTNRQGRDFVLSVTGFPDVHAPQGQDFVTLNVGKASSIDQFTLKCGRTFMSQLGLIIDHQFVGAGAFILPALPVAIIYAPPADQSRKNTASFSFSNTTGTSFSLLSTKQSSSGTPDPQFNVPADLATAMQTIGQDLQKIPATQGVGSALSIVAGAVALIPKIFGQTTVTTTVGTTASKQHVVTLTLTEQQTVTTNAQSGGPGSGDLIFYLANVRLCWFANNGSVQLALLGWDHVASVSTGLLRTQGAQSGLDPATIQSLLALDPFVAGGPDAPLPRPRFEYNTTFEINAGDWKLNDSYSFTQQDTNTSVQSSSIVTNTQAGWLSFLGIGPSQTGVNTVALSFSTATQNTVGRTIADTVDLFAGPTEVYSVEVYADVIFGTFAFRSVPVGAAVLSGTVLDNFNKPVPFAQVTLLNNGKRFVARADAQGRYAFHSTSIAAGNSSISYGQAQLQVAFAGKPLGNLNLKTPALKTA